MLGLAFLGLVPWLQRDVRVHRVPAVGLAAAPLLGALFGIGWTPCIGPTLGAVLSLSLYQGSAGRGALLTLRLLPRAGGPVHPRRAGLAPDARRREVGTPAPGLGHPDRRAMLIVVGLLLVTGWWSTWIDDLRPWLGNFSPGV